MWSAREHRVGWAELMAEEWHRRMVLGQRNSMGEGGRRGGRGGGPG